jgi:DHA1 family multidrug resistance protein-like MFS transporter
LLLLSGTLVWFGVEENFEPVAATGPDGAGFVAEWRHVISMQGVPATYTARFLSGVGRNLVTPILPLFIATLMTREVGVSATTGLITGISSATGTLGAVVLGRLGDRIGHRTVLIGSALGVAVFMLPQTLATQVWQLLVLQGLTGLASGGIVSAPSALLAQYTPSGEEGAVYGLDNSVWSGARALSPMIGSAVSVSLGMRSTFALTAGLFLLTAILAARLLPRHPQSASPVAAAAD